MERITDTILAKLNMPDISTYDENGNHNVRDCDLSSGFENQMEQAIPMPPTLTHVSPQDQSGHQLHNEPSHQQFGALPRSPSSLHHADGSIQHNTSGHNGSSDENMLASEPMGSLYEVTKLNKFRRRAPQDERNSTEGNEVLDDFISCGLVSLEEAEESLTM